MSNTTNPKTRSETTQELKRLDIQFGDKLILWDGRPVQVVEEFDGIVKVVDGAGVKSYIPRRQIKSHFPYDGSH